MPVSVINSPHGQLEVEHPEGATPEQILAYAQKNYSQGDKPKSSVGYDIAASGAAGVGKGTAGLLGFPADAANAFGYYRDKYVTNPVTEYLGGKPLTDEQINYSPFEKFGSQNIQNQMEKVTGEFHKPETTAGKFAESVGEFLPTALAAPGSIVTNAIRYGVMPGIVSEAAGQATKGTSYEPYARAGGAVAGGLLNPSRLVTPHPASDMRNRMVDALKGEGVTSLTAGQKTGSEPLRYLESASSAAPMAGGHAARIQGEGQRQFTEAAMRRAGAGPDASPEVLSANNKRLGQQFEDLSARNSIKSDPQLASDLGHTLTEYDKVLPAAQKQIVGNLATDIVDKITAGGGAMAGKDYQAARSRLTRMANNARTNDPDFAEALRGMRNSLDSAMERSIPGGSSDAELWKQTRKEYGAQKVIEKAASRAGEITAEGQITPANLRNTAASENRGAYARGEGQFSELSRAGVGVMSPLPNSGTAQRSNAFSILGLLNEVTAGAIPAATGRVLMHPATQSYLANQLIHGNVLPKSPEAQRLLLIEALQRQPAVQSQ